MGNVQPVAGQASVAPLGQAGQNQLANIFGQAGQPAQNQFANLFGQPAFSQPANAKSVPLGQTAQPHGQQVIPGQVQMPGLQFNNSAFGRILTDQQGRALYIYTKDSAGQSACYGQCATQWPAFGFAAVTANSQPLIGGGVSRNLISTVTRTDGTVQLVYNHWPLYYYYQDKLPGDVKGQTVNGQWFVIGPNGQPAIQPLIQQNQPGAPQQPAANITPAQAAVVASPAQAANANSPVVGGQLNPVNSSVQQYQQWK